MVRAGLAAPRARGCCGGAAPCQRATGSRPAVCLPQPLWSERQRARHPRPSGGCFHRRGLADPVRPAATALPHRRSRERSRRRGRGRSGL
eukprot:4235683-Pyramimonas_sp.AAC.1